MGQFDETIDPEAGLSVTPVPGLDALGSAVPPAMLQGAMPPPAAPMPPMAMPQAPQAPAQPGTLQHILSAALLGLAAGLGPRHGGGGIAEGLMKGQQSNQDQRQQTFRDQQQQFQQQQQEAIRQQTFRDTENRVAAVAQAQKERNLQGALMSIQADVKKLPDKATYDQRIDGYARLLQGSGYRLDANWLRTAVPYIAPDQKAKAQEALANLLKNPVNAQLMKDNPQALADGTIQFDANGDGVPENIPVRKLMNMAESYIVTNDKGQPLAISPSLTGDNMQIALHAKLAKFRSENNREPTPKEMDALVTEARTPVKDPEMAALARTSAELSNQIKQGQLNMQPTPDQEDMYAKLLTSNKIAPSQIQVMAGGMGQQGRAFLRNVTAKALQMDPEFNFEEAQSTFDLVKSPAFQGTIRYMDSVVETMPQLQAAADKLGNGNVRSLNSLINAGKNQFNNVDVKKFKTDVLFVSDEIGKILQGGGTGSATSDAKLRQAGEILNTSDSPRAIAGALSEAAAMMGKRRTSLTRGTYLERQAPKTADPAAATRAILDGRK